MPLPAAGCRVLDLTRALAGPYCTMILGDLGAEVIKVESLQGDMSRGWGPFTDGISVYYLSVNRNKRSVAVDLHSEEGLGIVRRIASKADVVVENFRVGVAERMGLGYDQLRAENPRLVYASISGFGRGGPYETWPGFDQIAQGMSGLMSITGSNGHGPLRVGIPIADTVAGMWMAIGVLAGILQQRTTGLGQRVDTSLLGGLVAMLGFQGQRYLSLGERVTATGNAHPVLAPYGVFETANGLLNIAVGTEAMWHTLCRVLELDALADHPDYHDNSARALRRDELKRLLEERLRHRTKEDWSRILIEAGIPSGPIYGIDEALEDPHVLASGCIAEITHPVLGVVRQLANPVHLGGQLGGSVRLAPPALGENTVEVLTSFGFGEATIQDFLDRKVIRDKQGDNATVASTFSVS